MALLGRHSAIADVAGLHLRGIPAWLLARTYHLSPGSRCAAGACGWPPTGPSARLFPWDIAQLGSLGHPRPLAGASPNRTT